GHRIGIHFRATERSSQVAGAGSMLKGLLHCVRRTWRMCVTALITSAQWPRSDCLMPPARIYSLYVAMVETKNHGAERAELQQLLTSGIFERSPGLAQLLNYVCNKYFDGTAADVKEYNIAVDALG